MATYTQAEVIVSLESEANYSAAANLYTVVGIHTNGKAVQRANNETPALGILMNRPNSGQPAAVAISGLVPALFSASITEGTQVQAAAGGKVAAAAAAGSGATHNRRFIVGTVVKNGGGDNQVGVIAVHPAPIHVVST